jgi:hypothetical protein
MEHQHHDPNVEAVRRNGQTAQRWAMEELRQPVAEQNGHGLGHNLKSVDEARGIGRSLTKSLNRLRD